jgi:hypothetical protein
MDSYATSPSQPGMRQWLRWVAMKKIGRYQGPGNG